MADNASHDARPDGPPVLDVVFVVDGSGSMSGERMASLNWAAKAALPALREAAADHPEIDVRVRVIRFADTAEWVVASPVPVAEFAWVNVEAGGESAMGAALAAVAAALSTPDDRPQRYPPPVIILLSDGYPSDDAEAGIAALDASPPAARAIRIPIAIGQDADLDLLAGFMRGSDLGPLQADDAETLTRRIRWAASGPVLASASAARPPGHPGPAAEEVRADHDGGLTW